MGLFLKIKAGLKKTRRNMSDSLHRMLHSFTRIDEDLFEELEELLVMGRLKRGMEWRKAHSTKYCCKSR